MTPKIKAIVGAATWAVAVFAGATDDECPLGARSVSVYAHHNGDMRGDGKYLPIWDYRTGRNAFQMGRVRETVIDTVWFDYPVVPATERAFRSGRAEIVVRIEDTHRWDNAKLHRRMGLALAALPGVLVQRLPPTTTLYLYDFRDHPAFAYSEDHEWNPETASWESLGYTRYEVHYPLSLFDVDDAGDAVPILPFGEILVHEFAHTIDQFAHDAEGLHWSQLAAWREAVDDSPCTVSGYAGTNLVEDFAESVSAWLAYYDTRGRGNPTSASRSGTASASASAAPQAHARPLRGDDASGSPDAGLAAASDIVPPVWPGTDFPTNRPRCSHVYGSPRF